MEYGLSFPLSQAFFQVKNLLNRINSQILKASAVITEPFGKANALLALSTTLAL